MLRFKKPVNSPSPISGELKEKLPFVTTMRDMPDVTVQNVPVCSCHIPPLKLLHLAKHCIFISKKGV
jgi:hypothetical protein